MTTQVPERAPNWLLSTGWVVAAIVVTTIFPYGGVAVALVGALVIRRRWKLFVTLAIVLLAIALFFAPIEGSGVGTGGLIG
jgi:hypothetical protein